MVNLHATEKKKVNTKDMLIKELKHAKKRKQNLENHDPNPINLITFKIIEEGYWIH